MTQHLIKELINAIGDDPGRPGLVDTPARVVKSWDALFSGYREAPGEILSATFPADGYDEIVILKDIEFFSTCEHHLMPFSGVAHVAYLPDKRLVGVSKLARLVECFARRLQIQERIARSVVDAFCYHIRPKGAAIKIEAEHHCIACRGVGKSSASMVTVATSGVFRDGADRAEFLGMVAR